MILKICRSEKGFEHASANKSYHGKGLFLEGGGARQTERETERKSLSATDMGHLLFRLFLTFYLEAFNFHISFLLTVITMVG